jgi:hypothetical protein
MTAVDPIRPRTLAAGRRRAKDGSVGVLAFFAVEFACLVVLQKFAVPAGAAPISFLIPVLYLGLGVGVVAFGLGVSLLRVAVFGGFLLVAVLSQALVGRPFSAPSFLLLLVLYFPLMFLWRVPADTYRRLIGSFQNVMAAAALMVFLQLASQFAFGMGNTLNIEPFVPKALLMPGYIYSVPIHFGASFVRPNGFFFLEPSYVSMFLASALIIELTEFSRPLRIGLYAGALIGCLGATGWVMMAFAAPGILRRLSPRMLLIVLVLVAVGGMVAMAAGGGDLVASRFSELSKPGSSGSERLVAPLHELSVLSTDPDRLFTGSGAGNMVLFQSSPWPLTKLFSEYGALTALAYLLLFVAAIWRAPNRVLAFSLFVVINFTGGYLLNPVTAMLTILLLSLPRPIVAKSSSRSRSMGPRPETTAETKQADARRAQAAASA